MPDTAQRKQQQATRKSDFFIRFLFMDQMYGIGIVGCVKSLQNLSILTLPSVNDAIRKLTYTFVGY